MSGPPPDRPPAGLALERREGEAVGGRLPVGFRVLDDEGELVIIKDHGARGGWVPLLVGGVFTAVGAIGGAGTGEWVMGVFGAVGLLTLYLGLVGTVNRPRLIATRRGVRVQHRPIPWLSPSVPREEIRQLRVERDDSYKVNDVPVEQYRIVVDTDDKARPLVDGIHTREQAEWIEKAIERHLGLDDDGR